MSDLKGLLTTPFNENNYKKFSLNFLKDVDCVPLHEETDIPLAFKNSIFSYTIFGKFKDTNDKEIIILSVKVKNNSQATKMQRDFVANLLQTKYPSFNAALVAYFDGVRNNWKLSFVTVDYEISEKGVELKYKPAKRFSFLVGEDEPVKTCMQQLKPIYETNNIPTLNSLNEAFSINRLSNEFYNEYRKKYFELYDFLLSNDEFRNEINRIGYKTEDEVKKYATLFCKKTLGQVMFLHFIQKKGWLGVQKKWGDGDKKFLINSTKNFVGINYFNDFLEPLFYEALNKKRENNEYNGYKIPFLNGGLFSPLHDYNWKSTNFNIPDDYWFNRNETGLLDVLSQYNFTVDETNPEEQEIAIDPEMLGKIFESLLETNDRSNLGAFYTPREIVQYLCEETLANRLSAELNMDSKSILNYIKYGDALKETEFIEEFSDEIDDILSGFTVLDPAVGSGAFLVGMLNLMVQFRTNISSSFKNKGTNTKYNLKLETIQNCLYGVDIEADAVEIAKLRLWLSLIVDQEVDDNEPSPLPNLNYNLRVGDSLMYKVFGLDFGNVQLKQDKRFKKSYKGILNNIYFLKKEYFFESDSVLKKNLLTRIEDLKIDYIKERVMEKDMTLLQDVMNFGFNNYEKDVKPYFLWSLDFNEVFEKGGFDIVVTNPPYVDSEKMVKENENLRNEYKNLYKTAKGNWDLFILFIELCILLTNSNGSIGFIVPNKLIGAKYAETLRSLLLEYNVLSLRDYSNVRIFKEASVYPVTAIISKIKESRNTVMSTMKNAIDADCETVVPFEIFNQDTMWDKYFYDNKIVEIILKLNNMKKLSEWGIISSGAATVNEAYEIKKVLNECVDIGTNYKKFINTGTIDPFKCLWGKKETQYIKDRYIMPAVSCEDIKILNVNRFDDANKQKLIIGGMCKRIECFFDEHSEYLPGKSTVILTSDNYDLKSLCCILNSKVINFYYQVSYNSASLAGGFYTINSHQLEMMPLPYLNDNDKKKLSNYYDLYTNDYDDKYLTIINNEIYNLYNLDDNEIEIIENNIHDYYL